MNPGVTTDGYNETTPSPFDRFRFGRSVCEEPEQVCRGITTQPRSRGEFNACKTNVTFVQRAEE